MKKLMLVFLLLALLGIAAAQTTVVSRTISDVVSINQRNQGRNPDIDVTAPPYNVRAVSSAPSTAGSITSGTNSLRVASGVGFQVGDGITIFGAGATNTLRTPSAPAVTPASAAGVTGNGILANGFRGSATYQYCVRARTQDGGYTACSPVTSISSGATTLGPNTVNISSISQTNNTVTVNTSAAHNLVVGAMATVSGTFSWDGDWSVVSVPSSSQFTFSTTRDTRLGQPAAGGATGTVTTYLANRVTWSAVRNAYQYYVYGRTSGAMNLVCISDPENSKITNNPRVRSCEDYGATMSSAPNLAPGAPSTSSGSASNGNLTTTITHIGGTTFTLAANAGNTVSGAPVVFDNAPNIVAAANAAISANAPMYFPYNASGSYVVESVLQLGSFPNNLYVLQGGNITLADTLLLTNGTKWVGQQAGQSCPSFSFDCKPSLTVLGVPGIYQKFNSGNFQNIVITNAAVANQAVLFLDDGAGLPASTFDHVSFSTDGNSDYMGQHYIMRAADVTTGNGEGTDWTFTNCLFIGGPNQVLNTTRTPLVSFIAGLGVKVNMDHIFLNRRGIWFYGGGYLKGYDFYRQGGITPYLSTQSSPDGFSANFTLKHVVQDTENIQLFNNFGDVSGILHIEDAFATVTTTPIAQNAQPNAGNNNSRYLTVTGDQLPGTANTAGVKAVASPQNVIDGIASTSANNALSIEPNTVNSYYGPTNQIAFPGLPMAAPTCSVSSGGTVAVGSYRFNVTPVGPNNGEIAPPSPASATCTTTAGNQTITIKWAAYSVATGYDLYRNGASFQCNAPFLSGGNTTSYVWSGAAPCGPSMPGFPGSGVTAVSKSSVTTPQLTMPNAGGFSTNVTAAGTATRNQTLPDAPGAHITSTTSEVAALTGQIPTASNGGATIFEAPGLADGNGGSPVTTTPYTIQCDSGTALVDRVHKVRFGAGSSVVTVPQSSASGCSGNFTVKVANESGGTLTFNRTGSDTFTVDNGAATSTGAINFTLSAGQYAMLANVSGTTWSVEMGPGSTAPPVGYYYLSQNCYGQSNCTQIFADGYSVADAASNSTTTVTCPHHDCNFTSLDSFGRPRMKVGQKIWATTSANRLYSTVVCPVTTVASFTAESVTLKLACTADGTANVALYWGDDDGATLNGLALRCVTYVLPQGAYIVDSRGFFNTKPACATTGTAAPLTFPYPSLSGSAGNNTGFYITPDFNYADCTGSNGHSSHICIGGGLGQIEKILFTGTGLTSAANSNCANAANDTILSTGAQVGNLHNVVVAGVCPGESGLIGIEANGLDEIFDHVGVIDVGTIACQIDSAGAYTVANDCSNADFGGTGLQVLSGAMDNDFGSFQLVDVVNKGTISGHGTTWASTNGIYALTNSGTSTHDGDIFNCSGSGQGCLSIGASPAKVALRNTTFNAASANAAITNGTGGTLIDQGGNTVTGGGQVFLQNTVASSSNSGMQVIQGICQGPPTASSTLGFYGAGENSSPNCTSTTVNQGMVMTRSGTLMGLGIVAGTSGTATFHVVYTRAGTTTATGLTCSLSRSALCHDSTHTFSYQVGDVISIEEVTGASGNPANVTAAVLAW